MAGTITQVLPAAVPLVMVAVPEKGTSSRTAETRGPITDTHHPRHLLGCQRHAEQARDGIGCVWRSHGEKQHGPLGPRVRARDGPVPSRAGTVRRDWQ
jgi:hypothetical protein